MKLIILTFILSVATIVSAQTGLHKGEKAPDFTAQNQHGKSVSLSDLLKQGSVVLAFYRGQWCPYCNKHMSHLQDSLQMITKTGASVVAITPEDLENIKKTIEKSSASFSIVYDKGHKIMDSYKVSFKLNWTTNMAYMAGGININDASGNEDRALPVPTTYIIAPSGKIAGRHFDTNYKERMSVKDILKALNSIKTE